MSQNSKTLRKNYHRKWETKPDLGIHGSGVSHGGFGRSSLQKCLDRLNQARVDAPAPCHSGVEHEDSSNPPQVLSPNVGEEQVHETQSASRLLPEDEPQFRIKEERKEEDVTPKSEASTAGIKEEPGDHDSEDSFRPEHVAEELQRLIAEFPLAVDPVPQQHEQREGATATEAFREIDGPTADVHYAGQFGDTKDPRWSDCRFCVMPKDCAKVNEL